MICIFGLRCKFRKLFTVFVKCNTLRPLLMQQFGSTVKKKNDLNKIRNIGIIAHIDAGKTTTTERMLYYSGLTNLMGEVHDGNTVMDYMHLERERGITITSAAITFPWKNHTINLIDTPGHVDFTFEVERSLAVLEGAVTILDSSAGVEVQTMKVWNQADKYELPCIVYLNKMDKSSADIDMCLNSLIRKLKIKPLMLHIPIGMGKNFKGVVDIVKMQRIIWKNTSENSDGSIFETKGITLESDHELYHSAVENREKLIEVIADLDDTVAEKYISEGADALMVLDLQSAIRRIVLKRLAVPVLCGSSYKNVGVQLLMDAIVHYLPTPYERKFSFLGENGDDLCAYVFKIIHDKQKDPLTFLRLFTGNLKSGQKLHNLNHEHTEKVGKLKMAYADDLKDVSDVYSGNIAVVTGLKGVATGDVLFSSASALARTKKQLKTDKQNAVKFSIEVPKPVFFCTIEPPSVGFQNQLDLALQCLQREDPTLCIEVDESLGQTILMGMGELHIEIIKERIKLEYGVDAYLGPLQVAYRETLEEEISHTHVLDKTIGGSKQYVHIMLRLYPSQSESSKEINVIVTKENGLGKLRSDYLKGINSGLKNAFSNGPLINFPVINVGADLLWFEASKSTSSSMISAATSQCILTALKKSKICLLEPVMKLSIIVDKGYAGRVLNDLSQKRSQILNMEPRQEVEIIESKTPLSELRGYSTNLRAITSGRCTFTMEFDCYEKLDYQEQVKAIQEVTGFAPF